MSDTPRTRGGPIDPMAEWFDRANKAEDQVRAWVKENGAGGWIDDLRVQLATTRTQLVEAEEAVKIQNGVIVANTKTLIAERESNTANMTELHRADTLIGELRAELAQLRVARAQPGLLVRLAEARRAGPMPCGDPVGDRELVSANERPINCRAHEVRGILDGRQSQMRRVVKGLRWIDNTASGVEPYWRLPDHPRRVDDLSGTPMGPHCAPLCPHGSPGDRLWVRETWAWFGCERDPCEITYRADERGLKAALPPLYGRWRSPIHMPRWASRITLEIAEVRVERLQSIGAKDILAEGAVLRAQDDQFGHNPVSAFDGKVYLDLRSLYAAGWNGINGAGSWDANPWVWALSYKRVETGIADS